MLQTQEIQQRFSRIEQAISQASQTCLTESGTPSQLKEAIEKLDRQSGLAKEVLGSQDESRIRKAVDYLEQLGDDAEQVCMQQAKVAPKLKEQVTKVHDALSDLKHQLH
ncbi:MAG: hypothetical protein V4508_21985 [Pseudomonadota bacterium]